MKIFKSISVIFQRYTKVTSRINEKVSLKQTILTVVQSLLLTVLALLIPSLIVFNLWIIPYLEFWLNLCVIITAILFIWLYFTCYYYLLNVNYLHDTFPTKLLKWVETSILWAIFIPFLAIILYA